MPVNEQGHWAAWTQSLGFLGLVRGGAAWARWDGDVLQWSDEHETVHRTDAATGETALLVDWGRLREVLRPAFAPGAVPPSFTIRIDRKEGRLTVRARGSRYRVRLDSYEVSLDPETDDEQRKRPRLVFKPVIVGNADVYESPSRDGAWLAGVENHNVYVRSAVVDERRDLTRDGSEERSWEPHLRWSPDSTTVAALRFGNRGVTRYPLVDWLDPRNPVELIRHPRAGEPTPAVALCFLHIEDDRIVEAELGAAPAEKLYPQGWSADSSTLFVVCASRDLREMSFLAVDRVTGASRTLLTEHHPTLFAWSDVGLLVTPVSDWARFIWWSERDGWGHLYLYDIDGTQVAQLTDGQFAVTKVVGVDEAAGWVYFVGQSELEPYDTQLYRAALDGRGSVRLTDMPGQHDMLLSSSKRWFLDRHSSVERPPAAELRAGDGSLVRHLTTADITRLDRLGCVPPMQVRVTAADGVTELHGVVFCPADFDPDKRYPILDAIYGGPPTIWAPKAFRDATRVVPQALAQLGFVVLVLDSRGTPGRGKKFQDVASGQFGTHVIADHAAALRELAATHAWIDLERVGVFGGSWGGYMTVRAMLTEPDLFKVGVATAPVVELTEVAFSIEPFMGTPQDNPSGYAGADLLRLASQLKGKLMLIHGTSDVNAPIAATMRLARALIDAGKDFELVVLPGENHRAQGAAQLFYLRKEATWFMTHLHPEASG